MKRSTCLPQVLCTAPRCWALVSPRTSPSSGLLCPGTWSLWKKYYHSVVNKESSVRLTNLWAVVENGLFGSNSGWLQGWPFGGLLHFLLKPSELQSTLQLESTTQKWSPTAVLHTCPTTAVQRKAVRKKPLWAAKQPRFHTHKKTFKPHHCKDYKYSASISIQHLSALTSPIQSFSNPVIHKVTYCRGKTT